MEKTASFLFRIQARAFACCGKAFGATRRSQPIPKRRIWSRFLLSAWGSMGMKKSRPRFRISAQLKGKYRWRAWSAIRCCRRSVPFWILKITGLWWRRHGKYPITRNLKATPHNCVCASPPSFCRIARCALRKTESNESRLFRTKSVVAIRRFFAGVFGRPEPRDKTVLQEYGGEQYILWWIENARWNENV